MEYEAIKVWENEFFYLEGLYHMDEAILKRHFAGYVLKYKLTGDMGQSWLNWEKLEDLAIRHSGERLDANSYFALIYGFELEETPTQWYKELFNLPDIAWFIPGVGSNFTDTFYETPWSIISDTEKLFEMSMGARYAVILADLQTFNPVKP